ncbi:hypothetical protein WJX72_010931 [[Myrmecia] bisecta]|uniref:Uncharacterized protein n=1 Tax=[Myrmecia] bisecta TaxID=41462 RepID=A0AAW1QSN1_9CHLO
MVKRGLSDCESPVQTCKRSCQLGIAGSPHRRSCQRDVGEAARQSEIAAFLEHIGVHGLAMECDDPCSSHWADSAVSEQAWCCVAELNLMLNAYQHRFSELVLRSYHSFTRGSKAGVFAKLLASYNCGYLGRDRFSSHGGALPLHMRISSAILQQAFHNHQEGEAPRHVSSRPAVTLYVPEFMA